MALLATSTDLLARYDARRVAELNSDTGTPVTPVLPDGLGTPVGVALFDATAMVLTALQIGKRYTRAQLETWAATYPDRAVAVTRVCCDLAMARLLIRRNLPASEIPRQVPAYQDALEWLERLRKGEAILDIDEAVESQLPVSAMGRDSEDPYRPSNWNGMFGQWPGGDRIWP